MILTKMKMKKYILYSFFFVLLSCSTQLYIPVQSVSTVPLEDLKKGREAYVNNCAGCHQLHLPNKYNSKEWITNLDKMQRRAKITDEEKQLIYQYVINAPKK